jgi:hypothetical protein
LLESRLTPSPGCTEIKDAINPNLLGFGDFSLLEVNKGMQDMGGEKPVELESVDTRDDNDMLFWKTHMCCGWSGCLQICIDAWAKLRGDWEGSGTDGEGEQTTLSRDEWGRLRERWVRRWGWGIEVGFDGKKGKDDDRLNIENPS